jgi:hypothetical protein
VSSTLYAHSASRGREGGKNCGNFNKHDIYWRNYKAGKTIFVVDANQ